MKKLIISILLLSTVISFAQETPKIEKTKDIEEITVTKRSIEKKSDRLIFDVANSPIAKGTTAMQLLQDTPMVSISYDQKELKILGKNAVQVFINGRKANMEAEAVMEMLRNTPSENISKIEIITVPSSEFQVEANQGIINIILKKKPTDGINGNLRFSDTQNYYNQQAAALTINFRKNKLGVSSNLNLSDRRKRQNFDLANGIGNYNNTTTGYIDDPNKNIGGYLNLDYEISPQQSIGLSYNNRTNYSEDSKGRFRNNENNIQKTATFNDEDAHSYNHSYNLNYELKTDEEGSKIMLSASYLDYQRNQESSNTTYITDQNYNNQTIKSSIKQNIPLLIDNYGVLADYIKKINKNTTFSFGSSYNFTKTASNTLQESAIDLQNTITYVRDEDFSNHFQYKENIVAFYTTLEKNFGEKIAAKIGTRYEITKTIANVIDKNILIERNFKNFLPYASLNYTISDNHNISYAFSSRIARPSFWAINPMRFYFTEFNYAQNNPFILPEKYYNQEINYMYKNAYYVNLGHTFINDVSENLPLQGIKVSTGQNVLAYIRDNIGKKQETALTLGMQKQFYKGIWNANNSITFSYNTMKGGLEKDPTDVNNQVLFTRENVDFKTFFTILQLNNTFRLSSKKDWFIGVNYQFISPQEMELGRLDMLQNLSMNLKKIHKNWTFMLETADIFRTYEVKINKVENLKYNSINQYEFLQKVALTATYNFGNQKLKKTRKIESANDDIKNRTGN